MSFIIVYQSIQKNNLLSSNQNLPNLIKPLNIDNKIELEIYGKLYHKRARLSQCR